MKIVAIGGSNTVFKHGYIGDLRAMIPSTEIVNRAIGAANCSMGLYRLLSYEDLQPGDVVIWEYALNDTFSLPSHGEEWLLSIIENTIVHARNAGCKFVPVIMTTREIEADRIVTNYKAKLHYLLHAYGLKPIDASIAARIAFGVKALPRSDFRDGAHYMPGGRVCHLIAQMIAEEIAGGGHQPRDIKHPIFARSGFIPKVRTDLIGGEASNFTNSMISVDYRDARSDDLIKFDPRTVGGRVLAAITLVSPDAGNCVVNTHAGAMTIKFTPWFNDVAMTLIKTVLGGKGFNRIGTGPGKTIEFTPKGISTDEKPRGVVAILTEEPV